MYILQNKELCIKVKGLGAELCSIMDVKSGQEYLWCGDEAYWKRHSPVLFPLVGSLKNGEYEYKGRKYPMSQHGFARDMEFSLMEQTQDTLWFSLTADDNTKKVYPFEFQLMVGYVLKERSIQVLWKVKNMGTDSMYFAIGAHPAFVCPLDDTQQQTDYSFGIAGHETIQYHKINEKGFYKNDTFELELTQGALPITKHMFDEDALILENQNVTQVSLLDPQKRAYVTVDFTAPLVGLWSPAKKQAPFVCIEPWYGRCDGETFEGTIEERQWEQKLESKQCFEADYTITIG